MRKKNKMLYGLISLVLLLTLSLSLLSCSKTEEGSGKEEKEEKGEAKLEEKKEAKIEEKKEAKLEEKKEEAKVEEKKEEAKVEEKKEEAKAEETKTEEAKTDEAKVFLFDAPRLKIANFSDQVIYDEGGIRITAIKEAPGEVVGTNTALFCKIENNSGGDLIFCFEEIELPDGFKIQSTNKGMIRPVAQGEVKIDQVFFFMDNKTYTSLGFGEEIGDFRLKFLVTGSMDGDGEDAVWCYSSFVKTEKPELRPSYDYVNSREFIINEKGLKFSLLDSFVDKADEGLEMDEDYYTVLFYYENNIDEDFFVQAEGLSLNGKPYEDLFFGTLLPSKTRGFTKIVLPTAKMKELGETVLREIACDLNIQYFTGETIVEEGDETALMDNMVTKHGLVLNFKEPWREVK